MKPRRQWLYALGLLALLPWVFVLQVWLSRSEGPPTPPEPAVVPAGQTSDFAGATWRLESMKPGPTAAGVVIPRDSVLLYVQFTVTPRDKKAAKAIEDCRFEATDGGDRTWNSATFTVTDFERLGDPATDCAAKDGEYGSKPIPVGQTQKVVTAYLVPKDVVAKLLPQVQVSRDESLAFEQPR